MDAKHLLLQIQKLESQKLDRECKLIDFKSKYNFAEKELTGILNEIESECIFEKDLNKKLEKLKVEEGNLTHQHLQVQIQVTEAIQEDKVHEFHHLERTKLVENETKFVKEEFEKLCKMSLNHIEKRQSLEQGVGIERDLIKLKQQRDEMQQNAPHGQNQEEFSRMESKIVQTIQQSLDQMKEKVSALKNQLEKKKLSIQNIQDELVGLEGQIAEWKRLEAKKTCGKCFKK